MAVERVFDAQERDHVAIQAERPGGVHALITARASDAEQVAILPLANQYRAICTRQRLGVTETEAAPELPGRRGSSCPTPS